MDSSTDRTGFQFKNQRVINLLSAELKMWRWMNDEACLWVGGGEEDLLEQDIKLTYNRIFRYEYHDFSAN